MLENSIPAFAVISAWRWRDILKRRSTSALWKKYRQRTGKQHDFGLIYGQNIGCRPDVLGVTYRGGINYRLPSNDVVVQFRSCFEREISYTHLYFEENEASGR